LTGLTRMPAKVFFDTNVLIYALSDNDPRSAQAEALLATGGTISVQVLNEFVSVARRKLHMSWSEVTEALNAIRVLCPSPVPIGIETHESALGIAERYGYEIYDALIAASALEAGCATLYSEDLQHRQVLEGRLMVRNPFS
jgi:predicted nucleic acid-binding protein